MKLNIRAIAALVIAVVVAYLAYDGVSQKTFQGNDLTLGVNTGQVELFNDTGEPVQVNLTAGRTFTVARSNSDEEMTSTRQGSGRNIAYVAEAEIAPGDVVMSVTRGSDVTFNIAASSAVRAVVTPRSESDAQSLTLGAAVFIVALVAFAAYSSRDWWMKFVQRGESASAQLSEQVVK